MTLIDVHEMFSTDEKCRELLKRLRWPNKPECPRCSGDVTELVVTKVTQGKELLYCRYCQYQFTVTSNTVFHDSHLPLIKWLVATYLMCESRKGMSANQMKRMLGVSYKTAWYLCHRIRSAMKAINAEKLSGTVEVDETYVGGKTRQGNKGMGRSKANKEIVIGIRQRGGELRFFHAQDVTSGTLGSYIQANISDDVDVIITDDFRSYLKAVGNKNHETISHSSRVYVDGDIHTNTIESAFSLLKRGIMGTWHSISAKHLLSYLDEMTFRFNRRNASDLFIDTLRHMITADPLTYEKLTSDKSAA